MRYTPTTTEKRDRMSPSNLHPCHLASFCLTLIPAGLERPVVISATFTRLKAAATATVLMCCAMLVSIAPATALPISGPIVGVFANPVVVGSSVDGATGVLVPRDNTGTAIFTGTGTNAFDWGGGAFALNHSTLSFIGNTVTNQPVNQQFALGEIIFTNGTSDSNSLVFGVDLTLSVPSDPTVTPLTTHLSISTTINTGTNAQNADFIGFSTFPNTFNGYESATAAANLIGQFVGDPLIQLTQIVLQPGQDSSGFIGSGRPLPEPGTLAMLALGFALIRFSRGCRGFSLMRV